MSDDPTHLQLHEEQSDDRFDESCLGSPCVLILNADRILAHAMETAARRARPASRIRRSAELAEARAILAEDDVDVLVTSVGFPDGDVLDLLAHCVTRTDAPRVLVVTARKDHRLLVALRGMAIRGVFDPATEGTSELEHAVDCVAVGGSYWSASVLRHLTECLAANAICRVLSPSEQLVLSVIGDGSDDRAAAASLGMKVGTVASVRRDLHRKLNVRHKGELVRMAVQHGFVRFTPAGVVRPGFSLLQAACRIRTKDAASGREERHV